MKKPFLSIAAIFVIFVFSTTFAQSPDTLWTITLSAQNGNSVFPTEDGGFVLGGYKTVGGFRDFYIAKVDASGDLLWEYTYGYEGISESMNCMIRTSDGGFLLAGSTTEDPPSTSYSDNLLVKTNADGLQEWISVVGANEESDSPSCVAETSEGGFVLTGSIWWDGYNGYDITLTKVNELGAFGWKHHYNFEQGKAEHGLWVAETPDGDFLVTGYSQAYTTNYDYDAYIMRTNSVGEFESFTNIGEPWPMYEGAHRLLQTSDGHILLCGYQNNDGLDNNWYVVKTGEDGWTHTIGGTYHDKAFNACETADGGYAVTGTYYKNDNWNSFIVRYTSGGDTLWTKMWGDPDHSRHNYDIKELDDGGFITIGTITTGPTLYALYLTRLVPGSTSVDESGLNHLLESAQIHPNPLNGPSKLTLNVREKVMVLVKVYDITGKTNAILYKGEMLPGENSIEFGADLIPGIYLCEIKVGNQALVKKLVRTK